MTSPPSASQAVVLDPGEHFSIWIPSRFQTPIPDCYQGTGIEIVRQMAKNVKPGLGTDAVIDMLQRNLKHNRKFAGMNFANLPSEELRATAFVVALLITGIAKKTASA